MKNWYKFYFYSVGLGLRFFINGFKFTKESFKRIVVPMDIARYFEIPSTYNMLDVKKGERVLDISSPKLLAFYMAEHHEAKVYGTDVWRQEIKTWKELKSKVRFNGRLKKNLKLFTMDGRKVPYRKGFFDKIFSVSVIEHIENKGDTKCIKELARVLKPGGRLVITTPFGPEYKENWVKRDAYGTKYKGDRPVFLSRIYDAKALNSRLVKPSGLRLDYKLICNEKYQWITVAYTKLLPVSAFFGLFFPFLAKITLNPGRKVGEKNNILIVLTKANVTSKN